MVPSPDPSADRAADGAPKPPADRAAADLQLVSAIRDRDRKATAQFVATYTDTIYAYLRRRLAPRQDLVDDFVQEVFLAALANLGSYQGTAPLQAWLLGIARHKVEAYYRTELRRPESLETTESDPIDQGPPLDDLVAKTRTEERAQAVLQQLPEAYGLALLWRYWEGRSAREIALATGRTEKAVERLLARARTRFREQWEG